MKKTPNGRTYDCEAQRFAEETEAKEYADTMNEWHHGPGHYPIQKDYWVEKDPDTGEYVVYMHEYNVCCL